MLIFNWLTIFLWTIFFTIYVAQIAVTIGVVLEMVVISGVAVELGLVVVNF